MKSSLAVAFPIKLFHFAEGLMELPRYPIGSLPENRETIINLQWSVVIGTSYLALFDKGLVTQDLRVFLLIAALLVSVLVLRRIPDAVFGYRFFPHTLVIVDTILITLGIGLRPDTPWDLFLLFFFCLFVAQIGETLTQVVVGCLMASVIFLVAPVSQGENTLALDSDLLVRIPFIFGVSILYGYLAEQVKYEKKRAEQAETTEHFKRQLVSALAHDIKNLLVVINVNSQVLASDQEGGIEETEKQELFQGIQENVRRISNLITSFLDVSKIEGGKGEIVREPVQLNHLIRDVAQQHIGVLRRKKIALEVDLHDGNPEILGDAGQLERALWNLFSNAIKYTSEGKIKLISRANDREVCVSLKDTGMGIPKEEMSLLFREFHRGHHTAHIGGTGLGLFIVKTIVEAHRGTVHVDSQAGQGSTFSIHIPVHP